MPDIDMDAVAKKVEEGAELTQEEKVAVMSIPPEEYDKKPGKDEDIFKEPIDIDKEEDKDALRKEEAKEDSKEKEVKDDKNLAPEKKEEPPAKEDFIDKLNREIEKPEGKEDLKDFSDREKAYFWQMRRDRRARQKAEEDRDLIRLERLKEKAFSQEKKPEPEVEEDIFAGRDPADFITIEDARKAREFEIKKQKASLPPPPDPIRTAYLKKCDEEAAKQFTDYAEVLACTDDILPNNPIYQTKVMDALNTGKNPAVVIYQLIKGDPEFPAILERLKTDGKLPAPKEEPKKEPTPEELKKADEAKKAQERLEENSKKPKTSGHAGGSESAPGEISLEQIANMSDREFAKLPKATRDKYLKLFGV